MPTVSDIKIFGAVKSDTCCDAHTLGIGDHIAVRSDTVNGPIKARGHVHLTAPVKGDGGGIHQVHQKRFDFVVGIDLVDGDWNFLSAASRETDVDVALGVERGVGYRVQIVGDQHRNFDLVGIAGVPVSRNYDRPGGCAGPLE